MLLVGPPTHVYVITPVPPLAFAVRVLEDPAQIVGLLAEAVTVSADGCVIVTEFVVVQLFASVTVQVLTPAVKPVITEVVAVELHNYVYAPVPPLAVMVAEPVLPPLQATFVIAVDVATADG